MLRLRVRLTNQTMLRRMAKADAMNGVGDLVVIAGLEMLLTLRL